MLSEEFCAERFVTDILTLNFEQPFLCELVPMLATQFADVFPELKAQEGFVANVIKEEETSFLRTLANGLNELKRSMELMAKLRSSCLILMDFPLDLTKLIASEKGWTVDEEGFNKEMAAQKQRGKADATKEQSDWVLVSEDVKTDFIGYDFTEADSRVVKYRSIKQKDKELFQLVLDKTPFYAESGGQSWRYRLA
jgi:alanyl-tRNA synthetase